MITIATFNILHGQEVRDVRDLKTPPTGTDSKSAVSLLDAVASLDADIIGLQEVDSFQPRSGEHHQTELIARELGYRYWRFVPTVVGTPGGRAGFRSTTVNELMGSATGSPTGPQPQYGIALLSRHPVVRWRIARFDAAPVWLPLLAQQDGRAKVVRVRDEQRAAIAADVHTDRGILTVAVAHLSFVPGYNVAQVRQLGRSLERHPNHVILMGDFNLPAPLPARIGRMTPLIRQPTYPSYEPRIQFDHILTSNLDEESLSHAVNSASVKRLTVSDHCAVRASLPFNPLA